MRENLMSGSMRGGWNRSSEAQDDLRAGGEPPGHARRPTGATAPAAYSTEVPADRAG